MTSADLIEQAQRGDREAFAQLAALEIDRLHATASLMLRDPYLAQDAVQETLLRCWRQLPNLRDVGRFHGWLYRILVRAVTDEASRRNRFRASVSTLFIEPSYSGSDDLADRELLARAFARLGIEHRAVVVLRHYADLALVDVATALGIPLGTAKSRYHYAMAELRTAIEAEGRLVTASEGQA
jgi:RNA polymerase sigma-70 factor, ECF subfamily